MRSRIRSATPTIGAGVPSCHSDHTGAVAPDGAPVVALAGAPNTGKSTLFNALTGARRTVGNWPGTSVEVGRGAWRGDQAYDLVDLPGAYSLDPASPDEELTRALLVDVPATERPEAVVVVADAAHLARSLYLVAQLREYDYRVLVALTMTDVAARRGVEVDPDRLATELGVPVVAVDARSRTGTPELYAAVAAALTRPPVAARDLDDDTTDEFVRADDRFAWIESAVEASTTRAAKARRSYSDRIDKVVLSRFGGPLIFAATMWLVFQITTAVAAPLQGLLDSLVSGPVSSGAGWLLDALGISSPIAHGLLINGLIAGVGMLLTFVPLLALMFVLLAVLEDSGYMARAAAVADRLMRSIGLPGKAFLPLIVGFGCNVPAISATRILGNARQRILTALLVPFTACSARLTVFVLVATVFFPHYAGTVVFGMYLISIALVVLIGLALRKTLWRTMGAEPLLMDLPPYQRPKPRLITTAAWIRLRGFLKTAGGIIVATVIAVWVLQAWPVDGRGSFGDTPVENSAYAAVAQQVAPVFAPAGFDQWEVTGALVTGFVAKEAVISSWAQTYAVADPTSSGDSGALGEAIRAGFSSSSSGHPLLAAFAFMVFLLAYTPCVATLAAQRREIGTGWTAFGVLVQLATAWLLAVAIFQIGSLWW